MMMERVSGRFFVGLVAVVVLGLTGCESGPEVEGTQWTADMATLQWGSAGNSLVQPGDNLSITFFTDSYDERMTLHGNRQDYTATWEVTESEGDHATVHVTTALEAQSFDLEINGDTMTYSRPSDAGTITATFSRFTR